MFGCRRIAVSLGNLATGQPGNLLRQLPQLIIQMRKRGLQRRASSFVRALHLVDDAAPRHFQPFAFLSAFDFVDVRTLAVAARSALLLSVLPVRLNGLAFESSCHGKNRRARRAPVGRETYIPPAVTARGAVMRRRSPGWSLCVASSSFSSRSSSTVRLWLLAIE